MNKIDKKFNKNNSNNKKIAILFVIIFLFLFSNIEFTLSVLDLFMGE